jgi:RNA polymerase sigma factor (TIGR02999 family)
MSRACHYDDVGTCRIRDGGAIRGQSLMGNGSDRAMITELLGRASRGDARATNELFPLVYEELRRLAEHHMQGERRAHTLTPTALVHEAYLRLIGPGECEWESRAHFFGAAARAIRRVLTDHARARNRQKRGGGMPRTEMPDVPERGEPEELDYEALDAALSRLAELDAQKARVVELRFFAGLPVEQVAAALGVSVSTVARDWAFARAWLHRELTSRGVQ